MTANYIYNYNLAVSLAFTKAFMRATLFSSVSPTDLQRGELDRVTTSHGRATIMRIWVCYSLNPLAEQNASDIIGVEWKLFI